MIAFLKAIGSWFGRESAWIVLVAVAAAGAFFYVEFNQVRADRDQLDQTATLICAGANIPFAASTVEVKDTNGKARTVTWKRGQRCAEHVAALLKFKSDVNEVTAHTLAAAMREQANRQNTDTLAARTAAEAARSAAERMEAADAEAERKNLVDHEWFAAVNGVAGLRPPTR